MFFSRLKIGNFPDDLKLQRLSRSTKKGDYSDPENYRPISRQSSLSKVFEILLYNRMIYFFVKNDLFTPVQFVFGLTIRMFMQSAK